MVIETFNRYENKYLLDRKAYAGLLERLLERMKLDEHNRDGQMYKVYNVYYDTLDHKFIRACLEKPVFREKVRLRAYEIARPDGVVYAEIKHKYDGLVNKRRTAMRLAEAKDFFSGVAVDPQMQTNPQVVRELGALIEREPVLVPRVHIAYERLALFDRCSDELRISFDHNIMTRRHDVDLGRDAAGEALLPTDSYVMEVKVRWTTPFWLVRLIDQYRLRPIGFSKYGREYLKNLQENYYV